MYHILLVEDDKVLRYGLQKCLEEEGYAVHPAENALQAAGILETEGADFLILDVNLPGEDGFSFYKRFACPREIPAVFLTARDEEADMLQGLDLGAEDYITKPFSIQVFLKKTAALLRRVHGREENRLVQGALTVLLLEHKVFLNGEPVNLSPSEYRLLEIFLRNGKRVLTKEILMEQMWEEGAEWVDDHALAVQVNRLRGRLGHACIRTVFGVGYMWTGSGEP